MHRRALTLVVTALVAITGCSDDSAPEGRAGDDSAATDTASPGASGEGTTDGTSADDGSGSDGGASEGGGEDGAGAGGTSTTPSAGGGAQSTVAGSPTTASGSPTTPATTRPGVLPPPPIAGCVDAPAGPAIVELSFDDDTLRYAGAVAPPCVRVHLAQRVRLTNEANFTSTVSIGAQSSSLAQGGSTITPVLGSTRKVGDVFDVRVNVLSASVIVQVLP